MSDQPRTVLKTFPAGHPRGSMPADEYTARQEAQGQIAHVVMDMSSDEFLVIADTTTP
ncbi:hypothetical protein [Streptomyces sp. NPDC002640]